MMKFEIFNRWSGNLQFTAEIDATSDTSRALKVGLAVKWAVKAGADLYGADLRGANLYGADLYGAKLYGADLYGANLYGANLYDANLYGANLYGANLRGANLRGTNLYGANLYGADLDDSKGAKLAIAKTRILPSEGEVVGWKKCRDGVVVKLKVPADAPRSHAFGRKCRAGFVDVLEVHGADKGISDYDRSVTYEVGKRVTCDHFETDWKKECAGGIHFFITKEEAEDYPI